VRVGAVDIGTNTVRLLVADVARDGGLSGVARRSVVTRLGRGVDQSRRLDPDAIERTLRALDEHRDVARTAGCDAIAAVATSAVRDAADGDDFLARAGQVLGVEPSLISGEQEAALSFRGVAGGLGGERPLLVIDLGGGSTEFVLGIDDVEDAISVDIGSVRLTERCLPRHPAAHDDVARARREAAEIIGAWEPPSVPATVTGVGGTFTSLAAILLELPAYDPARVHGSTFVPRAFSDAVDRIAGLTLAEIEAIPSLEQARAPVVLGGAIVAEQALTHVGTARVTVSVADILDGLALQVAEGRWGAVGGQSD
jgi:exopolyphosphatase/guanosine-5'-triphosphate,3'-diphosphate pyrophosphatase